MPCSRWPDGIAHQALRARLECLAHHAHFVLIEAKALVGVFGGADPKYGRSCQAQVNLASCVVCAPVHTSPAVLTSAQHAHCSAHAASAQCS